MRPSRCPLSHHGRDVQSPRRVRQHLRSGQGNSAEGSLRSWAAEPAQQARPRPTRTSTQRSHLHARTHPAEEGPRRTPPPAPPRPLRACRPGGAAAPCPRLGGRAGRAQTSAFGHSHGGQPAPDPRVPAPPWPRTRVLPSRRAFVADFCCAPARTKIKKQWRKVRKKGIWKPCFERAVSGKEVGIEYESVLFFENFSKLVSISAIEGLTGRRGYTLV